MTIAFLGTGIMGAPMCKRLLDAGYETRIWNRHVEKAAHLGDLGGRLCSSASKAVEDADVVIAMLSTGEVVDRVLFEADETGRSVEAALEPGSTVVVMSSIPVEHAREQARRLAKRGVRYVDAPVSGGERGAQDGTLTIMAGGSEAAVSGVSKHLEPLGKVTWVGPAGCGQLVKLANQLIVGLSIEAVAEAFLLIEAGGGELEAAQQALCGGFADSTVLRQHGLRMIRGAFEPGAKAHIQKKDLSTALALAGTHGLALPGLALVTGLFGSMCEHGRSTMDHSALILEIARRSGLDRPKQQSDAVPP